MAFLGKFVYIQIISLSCYSSISVPYGDWEGWWFEHSVSQLQVCLSAEGVKNVFSPCLFPLRGWGSLAMAFFGKFGHIQLTILYTTAQSQYLMVIGRNIALNTVCQSCRFSCQQKVLKTFSGPDYLRPRMSGLPMAFRGKFGQTDTNMAGGREWWVGVKAL